MNGRNRNSPLIPRPPPPKSPVDFIVEVFVVTVGTLMVGSILGVFLLVIFRPGYDVGPFVNAITDIMTTIIGALIGFIAGKGSRQLELDEEAKSKKEGPNGIP